MLFCINKRFYWNKIFQNTWNATGTFCCLFLLLFLFVNGTEPVLLVRMRMVSTNNGINGENGDGDSDENDERVSDVTDR